MDWLKYHNYAISGAVYTCRRKLGHVDYGTVCRAVSETWLDLQQMSPDEAASVTASGVQRMAGASVARTVRENKRWQSRDFDLSLAKRVGCSAGENARHSADAVSPLKAGRRARPARRRRTAPCTTGRIGHPAR